MKKFGKEKLWKRGNFQKRESFPMPFEYHSNRNYSISSVKTYHNERRRLISNQAIPHSGVS